MGISCFSCLYQCKLNIFECCTKCIRLFWYFMDITVFFSNLQAQYPPLIQNTTPHQVRSSVKKQQTFLFNPFKTFQWFSCSFMCMSEIKTVQAARQEGFFFIYCALMPDIKASFPNEVYFVNYSKSVACSTKIHFPQLQSGLWGHWRLSVSN